MVEPREHERLGSYRLLHELGRGGQAVVWLAEDTRLKRRVALKVLPALGPGSERVLARFRREAEVTSKLEHPTICPVYEADVQDGVPFLAMRYVEGETLARRITQARSAGASTTALRGAVGGADWSSIATFFAKIGKALHTAHEAGVVHRDIKPANVMVTPDGEPVILDFGLARQDDPDSQALSMSGEHSGTPMYMSPEQITGRVRPDRRSDVYSLGCTLFEVLTGKPPFEAPTLEGLLHAILNTDADSASRKNRAVPEDLAVITATATAKERDRRYKTALDFALDLERFVADEPIAARPVTAMQRVVRWSRRNPALAAALGAVLVLFLLATGLTSYAVGASGRAEAEAALRKQSDDAREKMLQAAADKDFAGRIDELHMKFGTLVYAVGGRESGVDVLLPSFTALLREAGIDLQQPDAVATTKQRIAAMRARDPSLADSLLDLLSLLDHIGSLEPAARERLRAVIAAHEDAQTRAISAACEKWNQEKVDTFDPLVEEAALKNLDADQLADLAAVISYIPGREDRWEALMDRAILMKPDSYTLHFMRAGITLGKVASNLQGEDAERLARTAVMHLQAAVALRPRSGLARATMSGAQALLAQVIGHQQGYLTAWQTMESATRVDPNNAIVWFFRADFLRRAPGRTPQAIAACKKALELDPGFTPAKNLLAELER
ncbi:MAG TPA: serine/threonine-protein kinase [Planctomycetota bacterium]